MYGFSWFPGRTLFAFVTICFILVSAALTPAPARAAGYSAIVLDADTGRVLHAHEADTLRYPASLTKMMTLYMAFDALKDGRLKLDQRITVSAHAAGQAPSAIGLRPGQTLTVRDAILAAVTKSANDATVALGEAIGGTESQFAAMMTRRAREIGMTSTTFRNASGLPNPGQKSTARDMATLARALLKNHSSHYAYFSTPEFEWNDRIFNNHNHLLKRYEGVDGIKTGYIRASGFNLVASAKRDGRRVIGVVFGGTSVTARDNRMIELLDTAFEKIDDTNAPVMAEKSDRNFALISSAEATTAKPPKQKQVKPAAEAKAGNNGTGNGEWAVQLGAFKQAAAAEKLLDRVRGKLPAAEPLVDAVDAGKVTLYRARLTGLTQTSARQACEQFKREKLSCSVVSPDA
jgi:D-alanyl-D-alanine carboxypeptidase